MARNVYALTEAQVEQLATQRCSQSLETDRADGTYLRALITAVQSKLGPPKRARQPRDAHKLAAETQMTVLANVAGVFYAAVLRGVTTSDIEITTGLEPLEVSRRQRERTRRATFARSAKSTLVAWMERGGMIPELDVSTVTKTELRASVAASRSPTEARDAQIQRAQARILASVAHAARASPDVARAQLEAVIAALTEALDDLPGAEEAHAETVTTRTRVGAHSWKPEQPRVLNRAA